MPPSSTLALALGLTAALALGTAAADDFQTRVAMREKAAATFYVPGEIAGFGPVELMVDTGSGYTTINEETLKVLKGKGAVRYASLRSPSMPSPG
jgi:hypothetical protein